MMTTPCFKYSLLVLLPAKIVGDEYNVYYGNLHAHTSLSDGSGKPSNAYSYARDVAGLDFLGISDHDYYPDELKEKEWGSITKAADEYNDDGNFVAFPGFEWTSDGTSWQKKGKFDSVYSFSPV